MPAPLSLYNLFKVRTSKDLFCIKTGLTYKDVYESINNGEPIEYFDDEDDQKITLFINPSFLVSITQVEQLNTKPKQLTEFQIANNFFSSIKFEDTDGKVYNNDGSLFDDNDVIVIG